MRKIICYLIINRVALCLLIFSLSGIGPFNNFLSTFGHRWDGNSYTFIATRGYVVQGNEKNFIVFPPLYPGLIKVVSFLGIDPPIAGIIISNLFFILAMIVLYKLIEKDWGKNIAKLTVILISIFPTTYFLSTTYPESLFIFLFAASFFLARKKLFILSALAGGLAASTRPFGLIILPSIILFMWKEKNLNFRNLILSTAAFLTPIIPYLWINYSLFGSPLAFAVFLKQNWQKSFDFPWNGVVSSWKRGFLTKDSVVYKYFVGYAEGVASVAAWIFTAIGVKKWKTTSPYLLYLFLGTLLFTSTGFILSAPRYVLSIPPFFIMLAELLSKNNIAKYIWFGISLGLLCWFSHDFALGRWAF